MKRKGKLLLAGAVGVFFLIFVLIGYRSEVLPNVTRPVILLERQSKSEKIWKLSDQTQIIQEFTITENYFEQIGIWFAVGNENKPYVVSIRLEEENGNLLQEWQVESRRLSKETYTPFGLDEPVRNGGSRTYRIVVSTNGVKANDKVGIRKAKSQEDTRLFVDGKERKQDLSFVVKGTGSMAVRDMYLWMTGGMLLLLAVVLLGYGKSIGHRQMFLPVGFILGLLYLTGIPIMAGPDETRHAATAYSFANELLGWPAVNEDGLVPARAEDVISRYDFQRIPTRDSLIKIYENIGNRDIKKGQGVLREPLNINKLLYLPHTLGITIGRLLNCNGIWVYYLGRLLGLCFYLAVVYLAIRMMPFGRGVLFFTATLPMCMQQAVIISYDMMILAFSFLMTAHILYLAYQKEQVKVQDWIPSMICMAVILPAKIIYIFIVLLLLLIPKEKYRLRIGKWLGVLAVSAAGIAACAAVKAAGTVNILSRQANTVPWGDEPSYTVSYLLEQPVKSLGVVLSSFAELGKDYLGTMIGRYLCTFYDIRIDYWILWAFLGILIIASIRTEKETISFTARQTGGFVFIFAAITGTACLSMMLSYTSIYSPILQGVQGRYFLPGLPILLLGLRKARPVRRQRSDPLLILGMAVLQIITMASVFITIISR